MANTLTVNILDENGNILIDATHQPNAITDAIPKGGISIDEEKLFGVDNFIIDARRAKLKFKGKIGIGDDMTIHSNNNDRELNNLKNLITDKANLIDDDIQVEELPCIAITEQDILNEFSWDKLFFRYSYGLTQTWEDESLTQTYLKVQSQRLLGIINPRRWQDQKPGGGIEDIQFCAFLKQMIYEQTDRPISGDELVGRVAQWLMDRMPWLDDASTEFAHLKMAVAGFVNVGEDVLDYISPYYLTALHDAIVAMDGHGIDGFVLPNSDANNPIDEYTITMSDAVTISGTIFAGDWTRTAYIVLGLFWASLIDHDTYMIIVDRFVGNQYRELMVAMSIISSEDGNYTTLVNYVPFFQRGYIANGDCTIINETEPFIEFSQKSFDKLLWNVKNIKFAKKKQVNNQYLQFGKTQLKTDGAELPDSRMPIVVASADNQSLHPAYFTPVERSFYTTLRPDIKYKYFIDGWNNSISTNINSFLVTGQFTETNWMYFDSIRCEERILSADEETFVDNIPVYDDTDGSQVDNYGLYIYRDYFNKYYTKSKSQLLNLIAEIKMDDNLIYRGLIDYNSVEINFGELSFDCLDVIGLLIDNVKKLESFIEFSQFDTVEFNNVAYDIAGTTLREFIQTIINTPFPYNCALFNNNLSIDDFSGLSNKILQEISAEDALIMSNQCMKSLLYIDSNGDIQFNQFNVFAEKTIDGTIVSQSTSQEIENKTFSIDRIKNIANYQSFVSGIISFFSSITRRYSIKKTLEIANQSTQINLLDKISIDGNYYIVISKNYNMDNKRLTLNLIGGS